MTKPLSLNTKIATLQQRRNKTRDLKQGMMQELLTDKTRPLFGGIDA